MEKGDVLMEKASSKVRHGFGSSFFVFSGLFSFYSYVFTS